MKVRLKPTGGAGCISEDNIIECYRGFLTLVSKAEVTNFNITKHFDMNNLRRVHQVEKDRILLLTVGLQYPAVLITPDTGTERIKTKQSAPLT
jgi:hypothetical protein